MKTRFANSREKSDLTEADHSATQRLDTWLWASRFYKTRKLSADEIKAGHVSVNNQRGKPARQIRVDDVIKIRRINQLFVVVVDGLSDKRLGAPLAAKLYRETEQSMAERLQKEQLAKAQHAGLRFDRHRPTRRDRQKMRALKDQRPEFE